MSRILSLPLAVVMLCGLGCAPLINVNYDYSRQADFRSFKTYDWLPLSTSSSSQSAKLTNERDSALDQRIKAITNEILKTKGFTQTSANPDLLVFYHRSIGEKTDITGWGYAYGPSWGFYGPGPGEAAAFAFKQETLILDLIDARKKELVFRGRGLVGSTGLWSPEERDKRLRKVLKKILAQYPPG